MTYEEFMKKIDTISDEDKSILGDVTESDLKRMNMISEIVSDIFPLEEGVALAVRTLNITLYKEKTLVEIWDEHPELVKVLDTHTRATISTLLERLVRDGVIKKIIRKEQSDGQDE